MVPLYILGSSADDINAMSNYVAYIRNAYAYALVWSFGGLIHDRLVL